MKLPPAPASARVRIYLWRPAGADHLDVPLTQARDTCRWLWSTGAVVWHTSQLA